MTDEDAERIHDVLKVVLSYMEKYAASDEELEDIRFMHVKLGTTIRMLCDDYNDDEDVMDE
jgi:predicted house-cleaning noncanonical NTP pyrophosphatase (MazG superfamily)